MIAGLECFVDISNYYKVPTEIILAVAKKENGRNGLVVGPNDNGSYDLGVMQINTWWFDDRNKYNMVNWGIEIEDVINNPCQNLAVASWILAMNYQQTNNWYDAVTIYNAGKICQVGRKYADDVFLLMKVKKDEKFD